MNTFSDKDYVEMIEGLHSRWTPHAKQIQVGNALFQKNIRRIFVQCGRKFGKSEAVSYMLWRWAKLYPGSYCYYIGPFIKQVREIIWANRRLQTFGPAEWLLPGSRGINNTEMRLNFVNGSFIKVDGSDNFEAYRGIEPHLIIYDEFKDFRPEFHIAMEPNLAVYNAPLIIVGTPPENENQYTSMAEEFKADPEAAWFTGTSFDNPHIDRRWLEKKRAQLFLRGEQDVWYREYEAKFVRGGQGAIFPMLTRDYVKPHDEIIKSLERDKRKLHWFVIADPGVASCFAVLYGAINPYTKQIYLLDEIYEQDQKNNTSRLIGGRIQATKEELHQYGTFRQVYDEAESWFNSEMIDQFDEAWEPTQKSLNDKESGLSLIKDVLLAKKVTISDRCQKLYWEMDNYKKDKKGNIPKLNDHLIDCFRYLLAAASYRLDDEFEYLEEKDENFRGARISDDFKHLDDFGYPASDEY